MKLYEKFVSKAKQRFHDTKDSQTYFKKSRLVDKILAKPRHNTPLPEQSSALLSCSSVLT
jgi:hypothetical protein